jgi:hypothetical protein
MSISLYEIKRSIEGEKMDWKVKKTKDVIEVTVTMPAREKASQPLVGISVTEAKQYLEENDYKPGECLNPSTLAGNLDTTRLTATWAFAIINKATKVTNKTTRTTNKTTNKTTKTSKKEF